MGKAWITCRAFMGKPLEVHLHTEKAKGRNTDIYIRDLGCEGGR
jgi:hypothetical protein